MASPPTTVEPVQVQVRSKRSGMFSMALHRTGKPTAALTTEPKPTTAEARRKADEDPLLFTYGRNKRLKGDETLRSVEQNWERSHISRLFIDGGMAVNVMARMYGNVRPVSMAKPRTEKKGEKSAKVEINNATAGRPSIAVPANRMKQTTLFRRSSS